MFDPEALRHAVLSTPGQSKIKLRKLGSVGYRLDIHSFQQDRRSSYLCLSSRSDGFPS